MRAEASRAMARISLLPHVSSIAWSRRAARLAAPMSSRRSSASTMTDRWRPLDHLGKEGAGPFQEPKILPQHAVSCDAAGQLLALGGGQPVAEDRGARSACFNSPQRVKRDTQLRAVYTGSR
jgi:hypothetical protein